MTAELLKNIIPTVQSASKNAVNTTKAVQNTIEKADKAFSNLLDDINKKYSQNDTQKTAQSQTQQKESAEKQIAPEKNTQATEKTAETISNTETTEKDSSLTDNTQSENNTTENTNTDDAEQTLESSAELNLALNTLNNLLMTETTQNLSTANTENSDSESGTVENTIKPAESAATQDTKNPSESLADTALPKTKTIYGTDKIMTVTGEHLSELEKKLAEKESENNQSISTEQTEENTISADILPEDTDNLVKFEQAADSAIDDILGLDKTSETQTSTSKISQETLDNLDVTVKSVEKTPDMSQFNNSGFGNQKGNAQEDIIKMTISGISSTTNAESSTLANFTLPDVSNIDPQIQLTPDKTVTQSMTLAQPKTINSADILNQIHTKVTIPQEDQTSKVSIILKPENLGKVTIEIMNTREGVTAKMIAETPQIKEMLDKSIESLKNTIASQGVNVNNISVKVEQAASAQNTNFGFDEEQFNREASQHSHQQQQENSKNSNQSEFTAFSTGGLEQEEPDNTVKISQNTHNGEVNIRI